MASATTSRGPRGEPQFIRRWRFERPELGDIDVPLPEWAGAVAIDDSRLLEVVPFIVALDRQGTTIAFYDDWTAGHSEASLRTEGDDFVAVTLSRGVFE